MNPHPYGNMSRRVAIIVIVVLACAIVLGTAVFINAKGIDDMRDLLTESIKTHLISTSLVAREYIDVEKFISYESIEDTEADPSYADTLAHLRTLAAEVDAKYIYALKIIDGKAYFVFDTDTETDTRFVEYGLFDVHKLAFGGESAADVMNVEDIYGSFNTGAVPIFHDGKVVGIVSTDTEDTLIQQSEDAARNNSILLVVALLATMGVLTIITFSIRRLWVLHDESQHSSRHDAVTGLPNRRYLLDHLSGATKEFESFALVFIDLDNFKSVNDTFGHDAGDELLFDIGKFLEDALYDSMSFRPSPGKISFAARIGGDEFIQVVHGVDTVEYAEVVANKLLNGFKTVENPHIEPCKVGLSIGIALYPEHSDNPHILLKEADTAMYEAKKSGKNQFRIYNSKMIPHEDH
jgi:diguanylate cyclase (GGDEF)-like protein